MAKLFPPLVEGTIPAFYCENGIVKITIPFSMNKAVSRSQVGGLALKIKTVQSSSYLYTAQIIDPFCYELENNPWVSIILRMDNEEEKQFIQKLRKGQFYKLQLAYLDTNYEVGYYSTVGISKYTTKPILSINDLKVGAINMHTYKYIGFYNQDKINGDTTERVYSYRFDVYDSLNKLVATSGEQLHNSSNDTELYESYDEFLVSQDLQLDQIYRIQYTVTTNSGLVLSTPRYRIMQKLSVDPEIDAILSASVNYDNGYIAINLVGNKDDEGMEKLATGAFLLSRACADTNYSTWDEISRFKLAAQFPSRQLWKDFTAEQGKSYRYSLQQYNDNGLYSNRILSNIVYSDFEDAYLYDGERQLKIKYNPKVSSFKADVLESKIDTIGSKHPFIFRNGKVYYREFPISGLISYYMDEEQLFMAETEFMVQEKTTNLISENLAQERAFKMQVYEWLTNGKPKLFRSPSEGNFIIRLMNVSMTPNDTLGRMLHTFNATAYEIAEYNYNNLNEFNFIHLTDPEVPQLRLETIEFTTRNENGEYVYRTNEQINNHPVYTVRFVDMMPGDKIDITFADDTMETIQIGVTGSYYIDLGVPIKSIKLQENTSLTGSMTYSYYSIQSNIFDKIANVSIAEVPTQQFIGEHNIIQEIEYVQDDQGVWLKNPKIDIIKFYYIHATKRSNENIKAINNNNTLVYYQDMDATIPLLNPDIFTLYRVGDWEHIVDYNPYRSYYKFNTFSYQDFANNQSIMEYQPLIKINDSIVSLENIEVFNMNTPTELSDLLCGNGSIIEAAYQMRIIDYNIEDDINYDVHTYKNDYLQALKTLETYLNDIQENTYSAELEAEYRADINTKYRDYILHLITAQEEEKRAEGLL